jgi:uncharacterized protein with FMN-binding domain
MEKRKKRRIIIFSIIGTVIIAVAIAAPIMIRTAERNMQALVAREIQDVDLSGIEDGSYRGSYNAFPLAVEVRVEVRDHKITEIILEKHQHGQGGDAESIPAAVVEAQSLQVDTVSGASYSSKAILIAIERALLEKS